MILYQTYPLVNDFLLETRVSEFLSVRQKLISNRDSYRRYKAINFTLLIMLIKVTN
jgi:hypothetical protein